MVASPPRLTLTAPQPRPSPSNLCNTTGWSLRSLKINVSCLHLFFCHQDPCIIPFEIRQKVENILSRNIRGAEKIPGSIPLFRSAPKVRGLCCGRRLTLHPSFMENDSVVLCWPAHKPTNQQTDGHQQPPGRSSKQNTISK